MIARAKPGLRSTAISQSSRLLPKNGSISADGWICVVLVSARCGSTSRASLVPRSEPPLRP